MNKREKSKKYARLVFKSTSLRQVLGKLRKLYKAEMQPAHLVIPYVRTCAAYFESKLNDSLLQFAIKRYGEDVADAFASLSPMRKLNVLVPVFTEGRYRINKEHFVYQRLASLIRVRNSITHAKSEMEEIAATSDHLISHPFMLMGMEGIEPKEVIERIQRQVSGPDITLGASKAFSPLEYHEALEKLDKWFFQRSPDKLRKVAMVVDRS
ncbi:MAG: hypothetical protein ACREBU_22120, partial [Nitrososphaera sp.]